jgi:hypothetical protein
MSRNVGKATALGSHPSRVSLRRAGFSVELPRSARGAQLKDSSAEWSGVEWAGLAPVWTLHLGEDASSSAICSRSAIASHRVAERGPLATAAGGASFACAALGWCLAAVDHVVVVEQRVWQVVELASVVVGEALGVSRGGVRSSFRSRDISRDSSRDRSSGPRERTSKTA